MTVNIDTHVEVVLVQNTVVHVYSGNENDHLGNRQKHRHFIQNKNYLPKRPPPIFKAKTARLIIID